MTNAIVEMLRSVRALKATPELPTAKILVGNMDAFRRVLEKNTALHEREDSGTTVYQFGGVPVKTHPLLQANRAVLMVGDEIKAIINLDDE